MAFSSIPISSRNISGINVSVLDWREDGTEGSVTLPVELYQDDGSHMSTLPSETKHLVW